MIRIIAGVNGAGKSSIGDLAHQRRGGEYWNPDRATQRIREANPGLSRRDSNIAAWEEGRDRLKAAIQERQYFVLETTLGGNSITGILRSGIDSGVPIHVIYIGLDGVELHIERVRRRVELGGHDIPEDRIRERYRHSREHLIELIPGLTRLDLFDNTAEVVPGERVGPVHLLEMQHGRIRSCVAAEDVPSWAGPIIMRSFEIDPSWSPHRNQL